MSMKRDEQAGPLTERSEPMIGSEPSGQAPAIRSAPAPAHFSPRSSNGLEHSVDLHIEELVLHGFAPGDRYRIGDAIERELTRILTEQRLPPAMTQDAATPHVDGGAVEISARSDAETIGVQLAKAIYGGFDQ